MHDNALSIGKLEEVELGGEFSFDNHAKFRNKERSLRTENQYEYTNITKAVQ